MDPSIIASLSGTTVDLMKIVLNRKAKNDISTDARSTLKEAPDSQDRIRNVSERSKDRLRSTWILGISMSITLFVLFVGMAIAAVVMGIIIKEPMYPIIFGGISVSSLFTVILWKPQDKAFQATTIIQKLEMILVGLEEEWAVCQSMSSINEKSDCIRTANKAALDEMSKLS